MSHKKSSGRGLSESYMKKREQGFDLASIPHASLKEYSALHDPNMRHYFENTHVQRLLYETGQIDRFGRVISLDKNKSKLNILEREFQKAEQIEQQRLKEEQEMRYRVQRTRFNELERIRKQDLLKKMKEDIALSKEMMSTVRSAAGGGSDDGSPSYSSGALVARSGHSAAFSRGRSRGPFFVTDDEGDER